MVRVGKVGKFYGFELFLVKNFGANVMGFSLKR